MGDLKTCPFCGGTPAHVHLKEPEDSPNWHGEVIQCEACGASTPVVFSVKEPAFDHLEALWNRRQESADRFSNQGLIDRDTGRITEPASDEPESKPIDTGPASVGIRMAREARADRVQVIAEGIVEAHRRIESKPEPDEPADCEGCRLGQHRYLINGKMVHVVPVLGKSPNREVPCTTRSGEEE